MIKIAKVIYNVKAMKNFLTKALDLILGLTTIAGIIMVFVSLFYSLMLDKQSYNFTIIGVCMIIGAMALERKLILPNKAQEKTDVKGMIASLIIAVGFIFLISGKYIVPGIIIMLIGIALSIIRKKPEQKRISSRPVER